MAGDARINGRIRIERCFDPALVTEIITNPKIYPHVSDDYSPPQDEFTAERLVQNAWIYFLTPIFEERTVGVFMVHGHNGVMYEVHTCILPEFWGKSVEAAKVGTQWMFENTPCRKLITLVPVYNRLAYRLALRAGMKDQGIITKSFLKNGTLFDQYVLGIEKG